MQSADEPKQPQDNKSKGGTMKLCGKCRTIILLAESFDEERDSPTFPFREPTRPPKWKGTREEEPRNTQSARKKRRLTHGTSDLPVVTIKHATTQDRPDRVTPP